MLNRCNEYNRSCIGFFNMSLFLILGFIPELIFKWAARCIVYYLAFQVLSLNLDTESVSTKNDKIMSPRTGLVIISTQYILLKE